VNFRLEVINLFRRTLLLILSGILLWCPFGIESAGAQTGNDGQVAEKVRDRVMKLGLGRDARVEVKLRDNSKLKGYVSAAEQDSFTVTDPKTGASRTVAYADASHVKKPRRGLKPRTWVIIGAAAAAVAIVGVTVTRTIYCDEGNPCN
jgi:hypothetical protein